MDKKIAIYCRVSTSMQSTDRQKEDLLAVAERFGYQIKEEDIYIDYITGYSVGVDRPRYSALLEEVEKGTIGKILFSELTRLGRNSTELLAEVQRLQNKGVELYFEKQDLWVKSEKKDLGSRILLAVLAITTSYEIELFAERSISGKIEKVKKGGGIGGDNNAYGYMNDENKKMVVREEEAKVIYRIFKMYADGKSTLEICDILNSKGIPTSYGTRIKEFKESRERKGLNPKKYKRLDKENFLWRPSAIAKLLNNELYKGHRHITFHKPQVDKLEKNKDQKEKEPEVLYTFDTQDEDLRIINDELFQRVQDRLSQAAYNKNNAIKHENLLKSKLFCGECGSRFSVGKQTNTATNYQINPRTYKCYGLVNRKDHPKICFNGAEMRQCRLDGLVLSLSLHMFAEINILESSNRRIDRLSNEISDYQSILDSKTNESDELDNNHKKAIRRLMNSKEDDTIVHELMNEETEDYNKKHKELTESISQYHMAIIANKNMIAKLQHLSSTFPNIKDRMHEIRQNRELVKAMMDEYIQRITIYKIHKLWNLIIVEYVNGSEAWGTIKNARYKNEESFYDELLCHYGIEFKTWIINNDEHTFVYNKDTHAIIYNGKSSIYHNIEKGEYSFEEFQQLLDAKGWIGSYALYDFEAQSVTTPKEHITQTDNESRHVNLNSHNENVLNRLKKKPNKNS